MSEHTLLLHIGYHKTGTTSLQNFLYTNHDQLLKYGWDYVHLKDYLSGDDEAYQAEPCKNGEIIYKRLNKPSNTAFSAPKHFFPALRYSSFDPNSPHLKKLIKAISTHLSNNNVIISAEEYIADYDTALSFFKSHFNNISVVIYLRRQDLQSESHYAHRVKIGKNIFSDKISEFDFAQDYLHYDKTLAQISSIIGKENIIVHVYEKEQLYKIDTRQDIISDFLSVLGIHSINSFTFPENSNLSISGNFLEMRRLFNEVYGQVASPCDHLTNTFINIANNVATEKNPHLLSKQERTRFMHQFQKGNDTVAREYLNRSDGQLFFDNNLDLEPWKNEITSYEADLTKMMAGLFFEQQKTIRGLNARIACLELSQKKQRPYLFIGAGGRSVEAIEEYHLSPEVILDNDLSKNDTILCQVPVKHPTNYPDWKNCALIVTPECCYSMESWLKQEGLLHGQDYLTLNEILYT